MCAIQCGADYQPPNVVPFSARRPPFGHRAPQAESGNKSVPLWLTAHRRTAMLAADKLLLRSTVKQRAIQLREKELSLFNDNFNAVGTQSAVLAGFAMTSFAEIDLPHNAFYAQKVRHRLCVHHKGGLRSHDPSLSRIRKSGVPAPVRDDLDLCQPHVHGVDDVRVGVGLGQGAARQGRFDG